MDTALFNGDFLCDSRGFPIKISGVNEILQRILIRLSVEKGKFIYDRNLGSELHKLDINEGNANARALSLVREALSDVRNVVVKEVSIINPNSEEYAEKIGSINKADNMDNSIRKFFDVKVFINDELKDVVIAI